MQAQVSTPQRKLAPITTRTFGRFRLERRIAYGGMAEILLATELRSQRQMVLKRILPQYSSNPEFVQYFIHEGRLGQRLTHPHLVETFEAGQVGETCYIALEYLRGSTCIELLRAASRAGLELPLGAAVRIVADAARGLHYAHTASDANGNPLGVVHRDVTPHNLFLCRDGNTKVLDFGIAKAASQLHHTRTGTIKGKFSYLAPEQIRGESIDRRVDVFALGIVLHELLTLKPLFRGVNDADTLQRILTLEVPAPERVRRGVPPGLGAVALRALQRDRERRLPSAEALADSIEAVAEAECIDASHDVVAQLLAELCPPSADETAAGAPLELGEEPSYSKRRGSAPIAAAAALGATGSGEKAIAAPLPLPPIPDSVRPPSLEILDEDFDLDELPVPGATDVARSPSAFLATPMVEVPSAPLPLPIQDTLPNPAPEEAAPLEELVEMSSEPGLPIVELPVVAVGHSSGRAPSLEPAPSRRHTAMLAAVVVVALVGFAVALVLRARHPDPPPPAPAATPEVKAAPRPEAAPPPRAPAPQAVVARKAPLAEEALLRVQIDAPATFTVDGHTEHPGADGALHLPPGHHKVVVSSSALATPRVLDVELANGDTLTRAVHPGRGRLRLAVSPWADVQIDGRPAGTTPFAPVELSEGAHTVTLKNGELNVIQKRRVIVMPERETLLRADLFGR